MKSNRIRVLIFVCAVLLAGVANADQPESKAPSASSKSIPQKDGGHVRNHTHPPTSGRTKAQPNAKGQPHSSAGINSRDPAGRAVNEREPVSRGNSANLSQASGRYDVSPAKGATVPGNSVNNALPARPPSVALHATSTRHRGPNPAVVGGAANAKAANAGAISGNAVHRKP